MRQTTIINLQDHTRTVDLVNRATSPRLKSLLANPVVPLALWLGLHVVLALILTKLPLAAALHGLVVFLTGLWLAGTGRPESRVAYVGAYIIGAEVMWRMSRAYLPWEFGKYALVAVFMVSIMHSGRLKGSLWQFAYFLLLLPSLILPLAFLSTAELRDQVSFMLSGPLALAVSAWFFGRLTFSRTQMRRLFIAALGPITGAAAVTVSKMAEAKDLVFSNNSNYLSSGGYAPNQVSSALGLGALLALLLALDNRTTRGVRILSFGLLVFLSVQCGLTFSRGGLYTFAGAAICAAFYLLRLEQVRWKLAGAVITLALLANFVLLPRLDQFTGGAFSARFTNTRVTGRDRLIEGDLRAWYENPIFGVGPGQANTYHYEGFNSSVSSHTEFTRLLAEHGSFGLGALLLLLCMPLLFLRRARSLHGKGFSAALMSWSLLYMLTAAMRLAAPSFMFGLASVQIKDDEEPLTVRNAR